MFLACEKWSSGWPRVVVSPSRSVSASPSTLCTLSNTQSLNSGHTHTIHPSTHNPYCFQSTSLPLQGSEPIKWLILPATSWEWDNTLPSLGREVTFPKLLCLLTFVTTLRMRQSPPFSASSTSHQLWASARKHLDTHTHRDTHKQ